MLWREREEGFPPVVEPPEAESAPSEGGEDSRIREKGWESRVCLQRPDSSVIAHLTVKVVFGLRLKRKAAGYKLRMAGGGDLK